MPILSLFIRRLAPLALALGLMPGCALVPADPVKPLEFPQGSPPLAVAVGQIEVIDGYTPPLTEPNVEHRFATPPYVAVRRWAEERLRAAGGPGVLRVVIRDAKVIEEKLATTSGLEGVFRTDQAERYRARLEVALEAMAPSRTQLRSVVTLERSTTVPEGITLAERETAWAELTQGLIRELDQKAAQAIRESLPALLVVN